ncbi:HutD/Ves family protein [Paraburkholderia diazotrophica]|nr:HutD family protein [Paraburkholderia diazotrophica]
MQVRDIASIPSEKWRNGKGLTRTLAAEGTDWRVSIAEVECDGPYSTFEGMTRLSVILRGNGVVLRAGSLTTTLTPFASAEYDGGIAWNASLIDGPVTALNVMCKRHIYRPSARALTGPMTVLASATAIVLAAGRTCHAAASPEGAPLRIATDQFAVFRHLEHPVLVTPDPIGGKDGGFGLVPQLVIFEPATV